MATARRSSPSPSRGPVVLPEASTPRSVPRHRIGTASSEVSPNAVTPSGSPASDVSGAWARMGVAVPAAAPTTPSPIRRLRSARCVRILSTRASSAPPTSAGTNRTEPGSTESARSASSSQVMSPSSGAVARAIAWVVSLRSREEPNSRASWLSSSALAAAQRLPLLLHQSLLELGVLGGAVDRHPREQARRRTQPDQVADPDRQELTRRVTNVVARKTTEAYMKAITNDAQIDAASP